MKYTYIGLANTIQGYAISELAIKKNLQEKCDLILYDNANVDIQESFEKLLTKEIENLIIDIKTFANTEKEMIKSIETLRKAKNCEVYIIASDYSPESKIVTMLKGLGYNKILLANTQGELRDDFILHTQEQCDYIPNEEYLQYREEYIGSIERENPIFQQIEPKHKGVLSIGVAGCLERIGTTTAAVQLAKSLNLSEENNACVIEVNNHKYTSTLLQVADSKAYKLLDHNGININNVNIYYDVKKTNIIKKEGYKYLIYDYGNINLDEDNSVFDKDIVIFVCGYSPDEILQSTKITTTCVNDCGLTNVFYLYNYVSDKQFKEIIELQAPLIKAYTHKLEYTPDMFEITSANVDTFDSILDMATREKNTKKKSVLKRLFG